jgi:riboflavin-specific deaminase-like protein
MIDRLNALPARAAEHHARTGRPFVTLTYAQSIDGSIAAQPGKQTHISGPETKRLTHQLRSMHDAILIGIGTVLADDPKLTARRANGRNPQPVILDTNARFPLNAQLLHHPTHRPWIITGKAHPDAIAALEQAGARVHCLSASSEDHPDLIRLLDWLGAERIVSLMVEGGAKVITSFLRARLVDQLILTIGPTLMGGLRGVDSLGSEEADSFPRLSHYDVLRIGTDLVIWGDLVWE